MVHPEIMEKLGNLPAVRSPDCRSDSIPLEHDATDASGNPILLAYDFDVRQNQPVQYRLKYTADPGT